MRTYYYSLLIPYLEGTLDEARRKRLEAQLARDPKLAAEAETLRWTTAHLRVRGAEDRAKNAGVPTLSVWPELRAQMEAKSARRPSRPWLIGGSLAGMTAVAATIVIAASIIQKPASMSPDLSVVATTPSRSTPMASPAPQSFSSADVQSAKHVAVAPKEHSTGQPTQSVPGVKLPEQSQQTAANSSQSDLSLQDPFMQPLASTANNKPLLVHPSSHNLQTASAQLVPGNGLIKDIHTGMPYLSQPYTGSSSNNVSKKVSQLSAGDRQILGGSAKRTSDQAAVSTPGPLSLNAPNSVPHPSFAPVVPQAHENDTPEAADTATDHQQVGAMQRKFSAPPKAGSGDDGSRQGGGFGNNSLGGGGGFGGGGFGGSMNPNKPAPPATATSSDVASAQLAAIDIDRLRSQRDRPGLSLNQQVTLSVALAKAYQVQNNPRLSLDRWQQALESTLQIPVYGTDTAAQLTQQTLQSAQDASQLAALQARLEKRRSQLSSDVLVARMLASVYDFTGDTDHAYSERMRIVNMGKASSEDWYQLGQAETLRGNNGAAAGAFQQALGTEGTLAPQHRETARKFVLSTSP